MKLAGLNGEMLDIAASDGSVGIEAAEYYLKDRLLRVGLIFKGFAANADAWVEENRWSAFLDELADLERTRQGRASVEAVSPDTLHLTFRSRDRAGHLAVDGFIGVRTGSHAAKLTFSPMEFDPTELPRVLRELRKI